MMRIIAIALLLTSCAHVSADGDRIEVEGPAVIGFAEDATHEDMERLNERAVIQDDFVTSWAHFATWAETAGIHAITAAPGFEVRTKKGLRRVPHEAAGYVVVNSVGESLILKGVRTDVDLRAEVCSFLKSSPQDFPACGGG